MEDFEIKRLYYTRSEVSSLMHIPPHILRAWEQRFPKLRPMKSQSGRILFRPSDLELVKKIHSWKAAGYTDEKIKRLITASESGMPTYPDQDERYRTSRRTVFDQMVRILQEILCIMDE